MSGVRRDLNGPAKLAQTWDTRTLLTKEGKGKSDLSPRFPGLTLLEVKNE